MKYLFRTLYSFFLFLIFSLQLYSQQSYVVKGAFLDANTGLALENVLISIENSSYRAFSDEKGEFELSILETGRFTLSISKAQYLNVSQIVEISDEHPVADIGEVLLNLDLLDQTSGFDVISLSDEDLNADGSSQSVSSLLVSRDPFLATMSRQLSFARYRVRGYDGAYTETFLNGLPINDLDDGRVNWSHWSGLNDVTRNQYATHALQYHENGAGDAGGISSIDLSAENQRKQIRATYSISNRTYRNRAMLTYSTGMMKNGFALSASGSRRWSQEGYAEATSYDAWSYYLALDKKLNDKHTLGIAVVGTPTKRGMAAAATQEMYDIAGTNYYNSYWGFQNGEKRNSRIRNTNQPVVSLKHTANLTDNFNLTTAVGYVFGKYGTTRLDWYDVSDPRPDYYRKLPSWYADETYQQIALEKLSTKEGRQLDWDKFYELNKLETSNFQNVDGIDGNEVTGYNALYHLQNQHFDTERFMFNSSMIWKMSDNMVLTGGLYHIYEIVHSYQKVDDLLGADFYLDIDKFAERDFPDDPDIIQSDLQHPNRIVYEGDVYGYNYDMNNRKSQVWLQANSTLSKVDLFASLQLSNTAFWREGFMQNGKFPDSSLGNSEVSSFWNYGVKLGGTYKLNGRNYLYAHGISKSRAPFSRYAFISPRTRNDVVADLQSESVLSGEIGYDFRSPLAKARIAAYYTRFDNQIYNRSFYHDVERSFVNFILTDIDKVHQGIEMVLETKLSSTLSLTAAGSVGQYFYNSRPKATVSQDNTASVLVENEIIYAKNYFVGGTPQQAFLLQFSYNSPNFWFLNVSLNYTQGLYLEFNPIRLTEEAVYNLDPVTDSGQWNEVLYQEKIPGNYSLDLFGGKSFKIGDYYLYLNLGLNNILNNQDYITGGYEQLRFDFVSKDPDVFPARYYYGYGRNYFFNLSLRI